MLQAAKYKKLKITALVVCLLCVLSLGVAVAAAFLNTNRDTRPAPEKVESGLEKTNAYELLREKGDYRYYFRDDRDIILIENKNTGYIWKTGVDIALPSEIEEALDVVNSAKEDNDPSEIKDYADDLGISVADVKTIANTPKDSSFTNDRYGAYANSLLTVEYYTGSGKAMKTSRVSSASYDEDEGNSGLEAVDKEKGEYVLKCLFKIEKEDLGINVYITFGDDGNITYNIPYKEITGKAIDKICNIVITPFLGTSGGATLAYDKDEQDWVTLKGKEITPGYALIPDGSGALVRFEDNKTKFSDYKGKVYGEDPATQLTYYDSLGDTVPVKNPTMPVFGISHGDGTQAAFVAYADSGDEYMSINATPSSSGEGEVRYTYAYPSFKFNSEFYQVINQAGESYRKTQDEPNKFDISMTYQFLSGDGSDGKPAADYTGMAKAYRQHLIDNGTLTEKTADGNIPIRIDFLMSDSKKGVFSTQEVDVTTVDDVRSILDKILDDGISNINSGLIGWQSGGQTLAKPNSTKFSGSIGKKGAFESLMSDFNKKNVDISFSREFTTINEDMVSYYNNAAKHLNTRYLELDKSEVLPKNVPVTEYGYAAPKKTAQWIQDLYDDLGDLSPSFTIEGASNVLISTYNSDGAETTVSQAVKLYQDTLENITKKGTKVNLVNPNLYLWKYADRYLQSPVGTSQYVYETDTVPFLQMVLHGTMEVYAPYANFSFYSATDQLRMIDYNISPSFVLTKQPSYLLASTTSSDYYSTEFEQYEELIQNIYKVVNEPLSQVAGYKWDGRKVLQDGVIENSYSKDGSQKSIVINYTDEDVTVGNTTVAAMSAKVIEGGVK